MALEDLQKERIKKLENIKSQGIDPFPAQTKREHNISQALDMLGKQVAVAGRLRSLRAHGKITFADLEDESGKIQLLFSEAELPPKSYQLLSNLDIGDFVAAQGEVIKTQAGQITVSVKDYQLLTKSIRPLPSAFYGLEDIEERYRQRYVDLIINPEVKKVFEVRHKVVRLIREFMQNKGFVEVETPTLQPIYGGATARPFTTHHNALDIDLYLRIADELYLKRLIVGGFEKVFEICKDFRNEGIDKQHNPEFTMIEFYWAYADYNDLIPFTEEFVSSIVKEVMGDYVVEYQGEKINFEAPFKRVTFNEVVKEYSGIDLDQITAEEDLLKTIKEKNIKLDLEGVIGYGPLCDELYKKVARPKILQPTLVLEYPADMKPLAKRKAVNPNVSESLQLVCMGFELTNSYSELNDPILQKQLWLEQMELAKKGLDEHQVLDEDYIRALEYGMPPTAGWAIGIDRFVTILTNQHTLKDVILFPTMRPEGNVIHKLADQKENKSHGSRIKSGMTDMGITRDQAYKLMTEMIKNKNLQKHGLAVEAIMKALCIYLKEREIAASPSAPRNDIEIEFNEEEWGIVGMLHDADYELIDKDETKHTLVTEEKLRPLGASERIINGVKAHHSLIKPNRENLMEKSVYAADELSGLITAVTLVRPDKKLSSVTAENVIKKFGEKSFAAGATREQIIACEEELGIPLPEFIAIALKAMQDISDELGL